MSRFPTDETELREKAKKLGVSTHGIVDPQTGRSDIAELQSRTINAERSIREGKLWWIAFVSALASVVSAIASWFAALK